MPDADNLGMKEWAAQQYCEKTDGLLGTAVSSAGVVVGSTAVSLLFKTEEGLTVNGIDAKLISQVVNDAITTYGIATQVQGFVKDIITLRLHVRNVRKQGWLAELARCK